jgi:drug/metabolite transporter superfamily protein YnfA
VGRTLIFQFLAGMLIGLGGYLIYLNYSTEQSTLLSGIGAILAGLAMLYFSFNKKITGKK